MEKESARVVEAHDDGKVIVEMEQKGACHTCALKPFCGDQGNNLRRVVAAVDPLGVKKGQIVTLKQSPRGKIKAAFILFIIPILFLIGGYFLGNYLAGRVGKEASSEGWGILSGIVFFALSFIILRVANRNYERHEEYLPSIVEKIDNTVK